MFIYSDGFKGPSDVHFHGTFHLIKIPKKPTLLLDSPQQEILDQKLNSSETDNLNL